MTTTVTTNITQFNLAQTFYVDPSAVATAPQCSITSIVVYFRSKPNRTGNKSGIVAPGVDLFLCDTTPNGTDEVPNTGAMVYGGHARLEYDSITVSNTASVSSTFTFPFPVNVTTGKTYAIVIKYDGSEDFVLWTSVQGDKLVGTNNTTAGPAGKYIGQYFEYSYVNSSGANANSTLSTSTNVNGNWKPLNTTDLKFAVNVAVFTPDLFANTTTTDPTTGQTKTNVVAQTSYMLYKQPYEFVIFDFLNSNNWTKLIGGETVYQNNVMRPETITVISGNNIITSTTANFTSIFGNASDNDRYIVLYSGTNKNVRKIANIQSNNAVQLDIPPTFSNASAKFAKVVGGKVDISARITTFGTLENALVIANSSANSSLRFVNSTIETVTLNSGGSGYANSDYLVIYNGGVSNGAVEANAIANLTTNSTGGITSISLTNKGVGFLSTPAYVVKNANNTTSAGSGANLSFTIGSTLMTEFSNASLGSCRIIALPVNTTLIGAVDIENPYGTSYYFKKHYLYYAKSDSITKIIINSSGTSYANGDAITFTGGGGSNAYAIVTTDSNGNIVFANVKSEGSGYTSVPTASISTSNGTGASITPVLGVSRQNVSKGLNESLINMFERVNLSSPSNTTLILSKSQEVMETNTVITTVTNKTVNTNISSVIEMVISSNNVYIASDIISGEVDVFYEKYAINNDYTDENTGTGRAVSKHISLTQTFANNYLAEDMLVYMDAYRPANTDIKVFAKILNSKDPSPFVTKDWTLLEIKQNANAYSSPIDDTDLVEFTWGFKPYPNTSVTLTGTVTSTLNSANLTGSNTTFNTDLSVGDMIKLYSPLFSNNYMITTVNAVTNSSSIVLDDQIANSDVVGSGFLIDKITYKKQAFNNALNNNVVRYYDDNNAVYDGYNTFAIKIVFLSDTEFIVPKIENIRVVGVTA